MENDKLVIVEGASVAELREALTGFCNMYNKETLQAQPRLTAISDREFAITFPLDIDFEIYCYFINYMAYPIDVEWSAEITAWATTKATDEWISDECAGKKAMFFIPEDDTEGDNVYMTTADNIGYKLGFSVGDQELLDVPRRYFAEPDIQLSELNSREFEEFR